MDHRLTPQHEDALIEEALNSYPLAPMPKDITGRVMMRIQEESRPALVTWNDIVISLTIAICVGILFFTVQNLPPIVLAKLRIQGMLLHQDFLVHARWLLPMAWIGIAVALIALILPNLQRQTRQ